MMNFPEQFAALNKAHVDAILGFAAPTATSAERFADLQMKAAKAAFTDVTEQMRTVAGAKDGTELLQLGTKLSQPMAEKATAYTQGILAAATETQGEFTKFVDTQVAELSKHFSSAIEQAAKSAPAGCAGTRWSRSSATRCRAASSRIGRSARRSRSTRSPG